jgi:UrcA family protein
MSIIARPSAVLLALAIATPGIARDVAGITTQVAVKRVADAQKMERRLQAAALKACGASDFSFAEYRAAIAKSDCYKTALADAHTRLAQADAVGMNKGGR